MEDSTEMRNFIEIYKCMPELWNCKNENYKNKNIRNKGYNKLLIEYKKIKQDGTLDELKKKIANMRTCYRRELKKVLKSEKSGAGTDDIYISNLWYFDSFDFLRNLELPLPGRSNLSSDEDESSTMKVETKRLSNKTSIAHARIDFLKKATEHLESSSKIAKIEDDAVVYANAWACMFRQINPNQQLFAKRAIDEILMMGRLNKLNFDTLEYNTNESIFPTSNSRSSTPYPTSSTPVVFSEESVQFVPTPIFSRSKQNYSNIFSGNNKPNNFQTYTNFEELLTDSQYQ